MSVHRDLQSAAVAWHVQALVGLLAAFTTEFTIVVPLKQLTHLFERCDGNVIYTTI